MTSPLWSPSEKRINESLMTEFKNFVNDKESLNLSDYESLHKFSVEDNSSFWKYIMDFFKVDYSGEIEPVNTDNSFKSYGWFPNVRLNFAKNMLNFGCDEQSALTFVHESGLRIEKSYKDLRARVSGLNSFLKDYIGEGDVLACYMPNIPETVEAMLGATSLGGVFTSTSSDFGIEGVVDRFGQSRPKVLVAAIGYEYGGKYFDQTSKINEITSKIDSIEKVIIVNFLNKDIDITTVSNAILWDDIKDSSEEIDYVERKFSDPLYIMYSSGTTGKPKCIVHSVGGTLLQHVKELGLHTDLKNGKNIFYFTTCGWMMWNWLVSSLYFGANVVLYEGSPAYPTFNDFVKIIDDEQLHIFGTSPKFLKALEDSKTNLENLKMLNLETILSTGAPLLPEQYDYVYSHFKKDIVLGSIAGGTDIIGCFFLGNPIKPVYRGELQCIGLGMDATCFDDQGNDIRGKEGELVCKQSFPSRPIYFLNDKNNERINDAYFNKFPGVWHHGDFIQVTPEGGVVVYGRSDATLNPGGVRIGTSEIYRQTETLQYIEDSICVGKQIEGDVEVYLFVKMKDSQELSTDKIKEIKSLIKANTTPRHVPRRVIPITGIPYTRSGKKMEMAVTRLINGRELNNIEAVSNPECLDEYKSY